MARTIKSLFFAFAFMAGCVFVSSAYAQNPTPADTAGQDVGEDDIVRVDTALVTLPIKVMDGRGRFIPDLSRELFHVYEDGFEQEIAYFRNAETAFTVALMLDASDSARLRPQYSIGYYPKRHSSAERHRIKVTVEVPDAVVRARKSYVRKR